jgi:hypothetical protein
MPRTEGKCVGVTNTENISVKVIIRKENIYICKSNDPYRTYICTRNKDAASASWLFSGRACMCETRRVFPSSDEVCYAKVLVNLYISDSYDI